MSKESLDPRQLAFIDAYCDPDSPTYGNAYQSALKAKYSKEYAKVINNRTTKWMSEKVKDDLLVKKAKDRLDELLDDKKDKKVVADLTKFVLKTKGDFTEKQRIEHLGEVEVKWQDEQ
jgi:hypothetical protein